MVTRHGHLRVRDLGSPAIMHVFDRAESQFGIAWQSVVTSEAQLYAACAQALSRYRS